MLKKIKFNNFKEILFAKDDGDIDHPTRCNLNIN
jgi:hypothetical protein|tara:strand:- start:288 stop:389 length:102 start_codon:yes stop_codon:yes gene_type:complete